LLCGNDRRDLAIGTILAVPDFMRLFGRNDGFLAAALVVGVFLLFHEPLRTVATAAHQIEAEYHVDLFEPLAVLASVFMFHQVRKRQEAGAEARAAAAEAEQARARSLELERLMNLSRGLAGVSDFTGISHVMARLLPQFAADRATWLMICPHACWDVLLRDPSDGRRADQLEDISDRALRTRRTEREDAFGIDIEDVVAFPMLAGATPIGVLLVRNNPWLTEDDRRTLAAVAAMASSAIKTVQILVETRETSVRDALTGCSNRAFTIDALNVEIKRSRRRTSPLSVVMFDVDEFKQINDQHGHLAGDQLLAEIGARLGNVLRTSDVKCRYGGDEFLVVLPDTPESGARRVAESIREEIGNIVLTVAGAAVRTSVSVGFVTAKGDERDAQSLVARADAALYTSKRAGRNRCSSDGEPSFALRLVESA
jgi:diguanylate cyclase (GGDEF)-like protein